MTDETPPGAPVTIAGDMLPGASDSLVLAVVGEGSVTLPLSGAEQAALLDAAAIPAPPAEPAMVPVRLGSPVGLPSLGRIVHFVLPQGGQRGGEVRPAIVVRHLAGYLVNLLVFLDGPNDTPLPAHLAPASMWVGTVGYSDPARPGTWHWPPRTGG